MLCNFGDYGAPSFVDDFWGFYQWRLVQEGQMGNAPPKQIVK
jgi:hypothetical protein